MRYTTRQLALYFREAMRAENEQQARAILAANLGFSGGKAAKQALGELNELN
ncbi:MAG: hypothetical protein LBQ81_12135 [Zoogloeaceae bacterium]|jgi:hypothetical protein|nr:hypothetical protein [Zoogloeaceae bacterium]